MMVGIAVTCLKTIQDFPAMTDMCYKQNDVIVHVVSRDITTEADIERMLKQLITSKGVKAPVIFVVNKIDMGDDFPVEYIHNAITKSGATNFCIMKTSAKTREGIEDVFNEVIRMARIANVKPIECIKSILSMDKNFLKATSQKTNKKCKIM